MTDNGTAAYWPSTRPQQRPEPRATYRLQFHKGFTFGHAIKIVPYLARLGVSHVYASPIHKARPGSSHGYDIVDHATINPELGGEEGLLHFSDALRAHGKEQAERANAVAAEIVAPIDRRHFH